MILETTYTDKEVTKAINDAVGNSFPFFQRLKMGGIGSHRIIVEQASEGLGPYINPGFSTNNVNLELRPKGILVHLKRRTQTYCWIIPFDQLEIATDLTKITDGEHKLFLQNSLEHNRTFLTKLQSLIDSGR